MGKVMKLYKRRLSTEESREKYILISKDALSMFPNPGNTFKANLNGEESEVKVEAVFCTCCGPDKPHDHYHLSFGRAATELKVRRGSVASVRKEGDSYKIDVK
jgi:hypothetical protein